MQPASTSIRSNRLLEEHQHLLLKVQRNLDRVLFLRDELSVAPQPRSHAHRNALLHRIQTLEAQACPRTGRRRRHRSGFDERQEDPASPAGEVQRRLAEPFDRPAVEVELLWVFTAGAAADQWQGRAVHRDPAVRMGQRPPVPLQCRMPGLAAKLARHLQSTTSSRCARWTQPTDRACQQGRWDRHLVAAAAVTCEFEESDVAG